MEHERHSFRRGEGVHDDVQREADGVREQGDDAERAALALTEAATRLSDRPGAVTDEIWAEATRHYDERQLEALVPMVAITNFFNRLNTTFRVPAGTSWD